ncbi:hypothetical protein [uncultured Cocleimonas sp.]|uniref:hypothetical protein n=1 Tax=uncultured Cocleimonas sp. TaxID=1051587 RepID=UPI00262A9473|nr:hypothetical protein [uncultured Cocleimonas sp.]
MEKIIHVEVLGDLSSDEIQLCKMYWELSEETNRFKYNIRELLKQSPNYEGNEYILSKMISEMTQATSSGYLCSSCNKPEIYKNRSAYIQSSKSKASSCNVCIAKEKEKLLLEERRMMQLQRESKEREEVERFEHIRKIFNAQLNQSIHLSFGESEISFKDLIYLLGLIKHQVREDFEIIDTYYSNLETSLTPDKDNDVQLINNLFKKGIINISKETSIETMSISNLTGELNYSPAESKYTVLYDKTKFGSLSQFVTYHENKLIDFEWEDHWYGEAKELIDTLRFEECTAFLKLMQSQHGFDYRVGKKTAHVLKQLLNTLSVAQVYSFIWSSAKDSASYYLRKKVSKRQASNTVIGNIERKFDRFIANEWDIPAYKRNFELPISSVSLVLFNKIFKSDDGGFNKTTEQLISTFPKYY